MGVGDPAGFSAFTAIRSDARCFAASTAKTMFAVLDWLYAAHGS
jgi:hypothetical protein